MHPSTTFWALVAPITHVFCFQLPNITGPFPVGTISLELVDSSRNDPLAPDTRPRALMVSIFYPTSEDSLRSGNYSLAPYLPPQTAAAFDSLYSLPAETGASVVTQSYQGAPIASTDFPVLIFSHGFTGSRLLYTAQIEDLVGQGWIVAAVDHTYDAIVVEFPDGTLVPEYSNDSTTFPGGTDGLLEVRVADVAFVTSALADETTLAQIPGLRPSSSYGTGRLQTDKVGVLGHSLGGATAAQAMYNYSTFACGANFDGDMHGPVAQAGLDRPFLQVASQEPYRSNDTTWGPFWDHLSGFRREYTVNGTLHSSYTDLTILRDILGDLIPAAARDQSGTIAGARLLDIETDLIDAFFGFCLKGQPASRIDELAGTTFPELYVGR